MDIIDYEEGTLLGIMLLRMSAYTTNFNKTRYMSFSMKDIDLPEKYKKTWVRVSNTIQKGFNSQPVYKEKCLKTKIESYEGKVDTNFP